MHIRKSRIAVIKVSRLLGLTSYLWLINWKESKTNNLTKRHWITVFNIQHSGRRYGGFNTSSFVGGKDTFNFKTFDNPLLLPLFVELKLRMDYILVYLLIHEIINFLCFANGVVLYLSFTSLYWLRAVFAEHE